MGILNVTPDSFFDGGAYFGCGRAVLRARQMMEEGADIIDVGGASSRPGAEVVSEGEELRRVIPVVEALKGIPISIDTCNANVARRAVEAGACLINDISGFRNAGMRKLAGEADVDLCVMHMQGTPQNMQINPQYPRGVVQEIMEFFEKQVKLLVAEGVRRERIILDPGIGFGKTPEHNITIIKSIKQFKAFGLRVLIGVSRKSFTGKSLPATLAIHTISMASGADIVRVHDVKEHRQLVNFFDKFSFLATM